MIDLHLHTNASDGELSPEQLVDLAIKSKLTAIAVTDHDTISGIKKAIEHAKGKNIEVVPGIEISCYEKELGFEEVHILGLFINPDNDEMIKFTERISQDRKNQKKQIIKNLNKLGFEITFEEIGDPGNFSIGRSHIAKVLVNRYPNEFKKVADVFDKYIGIGKPAYADRDYKVKTKEAIDIIKKAGGIPFLAHPGCYKREDSIELIDYFLKQGGIGIETIYPYHIVFKQKYDKQTSDETISFYKKLAVERNLLQTGGSDFHGKIRDPNIASIEVRDDILEKIKASLH